MTLFSSSTESGGRLGSTFTAVTTSLQRQKETPMPSNTIKRSSNMPLASPDSVQQFGVGDDYTVSSTTTTIAISNVSKMAEASGTRSKSCPSVNLPYVSRVCANKIQPLAPNNEFIEDSAEREAALRDLASSLLGAYENREDRQYVIMSLRRVWDRNEVFQPSRYRSLEGILGNNPPRHFSSRERLVREISINERDSFFDQLESVEKQMTMHNSSNNRPDSDEDLSSHAGSGSAAARSLHHIHRSPRSTSEGGSEVATALPPRPAPAPQVQQNDHPRNIPRNHEGTDDLAGLG